MKEYENKMKDYDDTIFDLREEIDKLENRGIEKEKM